MSVIESLLPQAVSLAAWLRGQLGDHDWLNEGDGSAFTTFLASTVVAIVQPASSLRHTTWSTSVHCSQAELVDHAIGILLQRKRKDRRQPRNLLTLGFGTGHPGADNHFTVHSNSIVHYSPNALVNTIKSAHWWRLHSLIGDACMLHLLVDHVICASIDPATRSYVQLAGPHLKSLIPCAPQRAVVSLAPVLHHDPQTPFATKTFPRTHTLHLLAPATASTTQARRVVKTIFRVKPTKRERLLARLQRWLPWAQQMLTNFQALRVEKTVARLCPLGVKCRRYLDLCSELPRVAPEEGYATQDDDDGDDDAIDAIGVADIAEDDEPPAKRRRTLLHQADVKELLQFATPKAQVVECVRQLLTQVVPTAVWGPRKNYRLVVRLLARYVHGRQHDAHSIEQTVDRMRVQSIAWMNGPATAFVPAEASTRRRLLVQLLQWIWEDLVQPIIRTHFYATTMEGQFYHVQYYRRPLWAKISQLAALDLQRSLLRPLPGAPREASASSVRFVPKPRGVRPIMNLSKRSRRQTLSTNCLLRNALHVLSHELVRQPRLLGASTRSTTAMHAKLCSFREAWVAGGRQPVYFVTLDVERCFDTMKASRLLQLLPTVLTQEVYVVRHHSVVRPGPVFRSEHPVVAPGTHDPIAEFVAARGATPDSVYVDGVVYSTIAKKDILALLKAHLLNHHVRIGSQTFLQTEGIPQGSVLSSLLCNLYYADFEKQVLRSRMQLRHDLLLRYTDDFCFLTTSLPQARKFVDLMTKGSRVYGCHVNPQKTRTNFLPGDIPTQLLVWCGLVLDPATMHVHANYAKVAAPGAPLRRALTVQAHQPLHKWFVQRILSTTADKCHALYFSPRINSRAAIELNAYQLLLVVAVKALHLLRDLKHRNAAYTAGRLDTAWRRLHRKIQRQTQHECPLTLPDVLRLGVATALQATAKFHCAHSLGVLLRRRLRRLPPSAIDVDRLGNDPMNAFAAALY
ncbi:telomerase reverse transcriptase [Achlya hypogyna]|uniref:Telomerase reverse transcriptase n=1 Tax=Achlya hypogyna TaxID=1202772 RepID=A0A1V9ZAP9_ACHHY|nr:telomerase reverse transcriptase [Achlya hypogyna]